MTMSGDSFYCHNKGVLLGASQPGGYRPVMLLSIMQCARKPSLAPPQPQRMTWFKMLIVP